MKKTIAFVLIVISILSISGCTRTEYITEYIPQYVEVPHGYHTGIEYAPSSNNDKVIVVCSECGVTIGELDKITKEAIVEKEIIKEVPVEVEVVIEKEVVVEKEIIKEIEVEKIVEKDVINDFTCVSWEYVLNQLSEGEYLENVLINNDNTFVIYPFSLTHFNGEYVGISPLHIKFKYPYYGQWIKGGVSYYANHWDLSYQDLGVMSGTVERVEKKYDEYGNLSVIIWMDYKDLSVTKISSYIKPNIK